MKRLPTACTLGLSMSRVCDDIFVTAVWLAEISAYGRFDETF
jgi:hypothetical protein